MRKPELLCIATGDFIRPVNVRAVSARPAVEKWSVPKITVSFSDGESLYIDCNTFEDAKMLRDKIAHEINEYMEL